MNATQKTACGPQFDVPIRAAAISSWSDKPGSEKVALCRSFLKTDDVLDSVTPDKLAGGGYDMVFVTEICGRTMLPPKVAAAGLPALCLEPHRGYHPYHAGFYRELRALGGTVLPAWLPEDTAASIRAVRRRRALRGMKVLVIEPRGNGDRHAQLHAFDRACRERMGLEIVVRDTDELKERAARHEDRAADAELARWYAEVFDGPGEAAPAYLRDSARLYLAEKEMLAETGAVGITVQDIGAFLTIPQPVTMPNLSYGPLIFDGYLACEEGDAEVLATEFLLQAGLGARPTMSNIYFSFRDRFSALASYKDYTAEMELADCRQCFEDNRITAAHFSTSGVLPPEMMVEPRYTIRKTVPSWPEQAMISATPKLGPVVMARLGELAQDMHVEYGEADGRGQGDQYGWYRGRWFIRLNSTREFAGRCAHHHYAIAPDSGDHRCLETLLCGLLRLDGGRSSDEYRETGWKEMRCSHS
jgi:hypothetical protein